MSSQCSLPHFNSEKTYLQRSMHTLWAWTLGDRKLSLPPCLTENKTFKVFIITQGSVLIICLHFLRYFWNFPMLPESDFNNRNFRHQSTDSYLFWDEEHLVNRRHSGKRKCCWQYFLLCYRMSEETVDENIKQAMILRKE
jgi:hypothetical protein